MVSSDTLALYIFKCNVACQHLISKFTFHGVTGNCIFLFSSENHTPFPVWKGNVLFKLTCWVAWKFCLTTDITVRHSRFGYTLRPASFMIYRVIWFETLFLFLSLFISLSQLPGSWLDPCLYTRNHCKDVPFCTDGKVENKTPGLVH